MSSSQKKGQENGWDFWKRIGSPKYVSAPMIGASTLACRKLFRKYSVDLCYSPMIIASLFLEDSDYREKILTTDSDDRPLFIQFCGDNAQIMAQAAKQVQHLCDSVDINFGCPQAFAEKCHYGAYLQDEWDLMREIVSTMNRELDVCVSAKFRMQATIDKTVGMAQMLQESGAQVITMHEQITVPFIANGGIISLEQADHILDLTKANAVMVGEGLRRNPALFAGIERNPYKLCNELIDISKKEPQNVYYPQPFEFIIEQVHRILLNNMEGSSYPIQSYDSKKRKRNKIREETSTNIFHKHWDLREQLIGVKTLTSLEQILAEAEKREKSNEDPPPKPGRHSVVQEDNDTIISGTSIFDEGSDS
ncbi:MAG: putative t-diRNAhydrouridine synthase [Streblomastix strix]|uniref:tRNA-dihydrouridine(16/17) synthase [NAD(P)(+)] n=1 Tax=Streblomastix strix TaxID=222440 RepID=A0A5J4VX49_9EUKA|nr:MAG: putative t-diRNAhydrouridine synthase [Streblomastix strix]